MESNYVDTLSMKNITDETDTQLMNELLCQGKKKLRNSPRSQHKRPRGRGGVGENIFKEHKNTSITG